MWRLVDASTKKGQGGVGSFYKGSVEEGGAIESLEHVGLSSHTYIRCIPLRVLYLVPFL